MASPGRPTRGRRAWALSPRGGVCPPGGIGVLFFPGPPQEAEDSGDPSNLFSRNAYNFTAALYDAGSETLYYYELDT